MSNRSEASLLFRDQASAPVSRIWRIRTRTPKDAYFCPVIKPFGESVDPTGCGNCSTGAAAYAYFAGEHPAMVAAMANVAGGYNAAQTPLRR